MFFHLAEFSKHVWISGFSTKPTDIDAILSSIHEKFSGVTVQLVDLDRVPGSRYILLAVLNALRSFDSKQPIAKTLGMEVLLYIAANRQIGEAIPRVGIGLSTRRIAAILVGSSREELTEAIDLLNQTIPGKSDDSLVDEWPPKRLRNVQTGFGIGSQELKATLRTDEAQTDALERLAAERSALLTIKK